MPIYCQACRKWIDDNLYQVKEGDDFEYYHSQCLPDGAVIVSVIESPKAILRGHIKCTEADRKAWAKDRHAIIRGARKVKVERNAGIISDRQAGMKFTEIAEKWGISASRANVIYQRGRQ